MGDATVTVVNPNRARMAATVAMLNEIGVICLETEQAPKVNDGSWAFVVRDLHPEIGRSHCFIAQLIAFFHHDSTVTVSPVPSATS